MIDFSLADENRLVRESVREFVAAEILPNIRAWDEQGEAHSEVFAKMGELGYLGAPIPEAWGGAGMDYVSLAIPCEELERADTLIQADYAVGYREDRPIRCEPLPAQGFERWPALGGGR